MGRNLKKSVFCAFLIGFTCFFSSCMRVQINGEIKEDGGAALGLTYGLSTDYFSEDDLKDEAKEYEIKRFKIDGKEYVGYSYMEDLKSTAEFDNALTQMSDKESTLFKEAKTTIKHGIVKNKYIFEATSEVLVDDSVDTTDSYLDSSDLIKVDFTLVMPGKINSYDGGVLMADGRTILFNIDPEKETRIYCESESIAFTQIAIGLVLITGGVVAALLLFSKKKKSSDF